MIYHVAGAAVCIQSSLHQSAKTNRIEELLTCLVALVPFFRLKRSNARKSIIWRRRHPRQIDQTTKATEVSKVI